MSHTRIILFVLTSWACSLMMDDLQAQAPQPRPQFVQAQQGRRATNVNVRRTAPTVTNSPIAENHAPSATEGARTYIAVIGAVNQPAVIETSEQSLPLGTLIQRTGGLSADSMGTVCLLDSERAHSIESIERTIHQRIENGQIVFLIPRGGNSPTQLLASRPVTTRILITGLTAGPRLYRLDRQGWLFGDLLVNLGQSTQMFELGDVYATHPQGVRMTLDNELVANTIIHFNPAAVSQEGLRDAFLRGFRLEPTIRLDAQASTTTAPSATARPENPTPVPSNKKSTYVPRPQPALEGSLPPETSSLIPEELTPPSDGSEIEAAGSSSVSREPLPLPREADSNEEPSSPEPRTKAESRPPLMMPKSWQEPQGNSSDSDPDNTRIIERTSAGHHKQGHRVVTASASNSIEDQPSRPTKPSSGPDLSEIENEGLGDETGEATSLLSGPQSWIILVLVGGIVGASFIVSRFISRPDFVTRAARTQTEGFSAPPAPTQPSKAIPKPEGAAQTIKITPVTRASAGTPRPSAAAREPVNAPKTGPAQETVSEDDQRFLQRLIINKVTVVEEEPDPPQVDHLHGMAVGGSRLIIHEAHESVSGPHFHVHPQGDVREIELRLRRLLRTDRLKKREDIVHTGEFRESRETHGGPLERALRTVERGVTQ